MRRKSLMFYVHAIFFLAYFSGFLGPMYILGLVNFDTKFFQFYCNPHIGKASDKIGLILIKNKGCHKFFISYV
jgi:hypothetical protein